MTAKQYLRQAYRLNETVESNLKELQKLRDLSVSVSAGLSQTGVHTGCNGDKLAAIVAKIVDLETALNNETDRLIDTKADVYKTIGRVSDADEQLLLRLRYIEFCTWEQITEIMHFSYPQIHRIHVDALKNVDYILNMIQDVIE